MGRLNSEIYSVSHSEMDTYKTCRRRWYLQYYRKLRRRREPRAKARDTGILVHAALYTFYIAGGLNGEKSEELMYQYLDNARDEDMLKCDETERKDVLDVHKTSRILCEGYIEWLHETGADVGFTFDHSEVTLRAPGPVPNTEIMGIIDLGGTEERSGDLFVMDTKVTDSIDTMLKTLHLMEQGPMYAVLAKINDPNPNRGFRVIWNMVKRSKQTARAKPPFYQRYELAINADQLRQFYLQLQGQIEDILRTEEMLNKGESHIKVAYPTPTRDCSWKCPYFSICGAMNDVTRNDIDYLIQAYYTTPEQREADRLESPEGEAESLAV
jgi:hypothetical protein